MSAQPPGSPFRIDVALDAADLEQLWAPVDSEENEIPAVGPLPPAGPAAPRDPIDWDFCHDLERTLLGDMIDRYFRATLVGAEKLPERGPVIVAPNHSGNAFPHDAVVLDGLLWRHSGRTKAAKFRSVYTPQLAAVWWMRFYGIDNWWRRGGGVDMTFGNYDKLLERGDRVIYYPEGVPGIGKGFLKRYQLQHFHSSFVVLADKHDTPIHPVSVVNAEWVNPTSVTFPWLNDFFRRTVGLPFFPVPTVFVAALLPFVFYLAFPCRMVFVVGDAIDVRALLREETGGDAGTPDRDALVRVAERVRALSQERLNDAVARHGRKPWDLRGLAKSLWSVRGRIFRTTPLGWPYAFLQFARDRERAPAKTFVHRWLRDLDILFYYLPLGWLGIALMRVLRRPPYGYRGLTEEQRIEREGAFRWSLETRPLPTREHLDAEPPPDPGGGPAGA